MIPTATLFQTDEPCPSCGEDLVVEDTGRRWLRAECRSCGHAERWDGGGWIPRSRAWECP